LKRLTVLPFKKDEYFVCMIPHLAYVFLHDKPVTSIQLTDDEYKRIVQDLDDLNKSLITKQPSRLFIITNTDCHGRCKYCYEASYRTKPLKLYLDDLKQAISKLNMDSIENVILYGGEPFLDPEHTFDIIAFIQDDLKCRNVHVVTSLFYDDNTFLKVLSFCQNRNVSLTISMDPPSKDYPRIYKNENVYDFLLRRIQVIAETTDIIFGIRSTISNWAYDGVQQFKDVNSICHKPISINFDLIKGFDIEQDKLFYFIQSWCSFSKEVIKHLLGRTFGTIFHPSFNALLKGQSLISILKNCDAGRGRIAILPNGKLTLCNEDVTGQNDLRFDYDTIYPFDELCHTCMFKYTCGYHCFTIDKRFRNNYCSFHTSLFIESFRQFIRIRALDEIDEWINKQPIQLKLTGAST